MVLAAEGQLVAPGGDDFVAGAEESVAEACVTVLRSGCVMGSLTCLRRQGAGE